MLPVFLGPLTSPAVWRVIFVARMIGLCFLLMVVPNLGLDFSPCSSKTDDWVYLVLDVFPVPSNLCAGSLICRGCSAGTAVVLGVSCLAICFVFSFGGMVQR